jgi:hypothetical protein
LLGDLSASPVRLGWLVGSAWAANSLYVPVRDELSRVLCSCTLGELIVLTGVVSVDLATTSEEKQPDVCSQGA